jgi:outer membrane protein TolC
LQEQIQVSQSLLELTEVRFGVGAGSAVDVLQQRQQLEATQAEIPVVRSTLNTSYHQLAVLLGSTPGSLDMLAPDGRLPALPPFPQLGAPALLLMARPDLQAAQLRLQAADFRVAAAVAERLPRLVLDLSYEFSARSFATVFRQEVGSLVGNLVLPLIDGGRRRNQVLRQKAATQELLDRFGQAYLEALLEIEDALVRERFQVELIKNLENQISLAQATLQESQSRYVYGLINYLTVLIAVQSLQGLQRRMISENRGLLSNRARLYRALGGHWTNSVAPPASFQFTQAASGTHRMRP